MSSGPTESVHLSPSIHDQIYRTRTQLTNYRFIRGLVKFATTASVMLLSVGVIDFIWPLPVWVRGICLVALLAVALGLLFRWLIHHRDLDEVVATQEMEAAHPELGQRLRTAYQFESAESSLTPQLTSALIKDTNRRAHAIDFADAVNWRGLLPSAALLVAGAMLLVGVLAVWQETRITLGRVLLFPVHYSSIVLQPLDSLVAGSEARFSAVVRGRPLSHVHLQVRPVGSQEWSVQDMTSTNPSDDAKLIGELTASRTECHQDLEYQAVGDTVSSAVHTLTVLQPLTLERFVATVEPPRYTGVAIETKEQTDFSVPEGSLVGWELELSRQPKTVKLVPTRDQASSVPRLTVAGTTVACAPQQLEENVVYELQATTADGMALRERIRIRVKKDKGPVVRFQRPDDQLEATPTTEVGLRLLASDDFGLGKVGIEYQINGSPKQTLWEADLSDRKETNLSTEPVVFLENHKLSHDDAITYYAFAEDNREAPKRTRSELHFIDIRPYKRDYEMVDGQCQGGSGSCLSLEELIARQRQNLRRTFANLDRQPIRDTLAERLWTTQAEIHAATQEFAQGWERQFGPMPMLHLAADAMEAAVSDLREGSLDPAMAHQETALAELIKARKNVRNYLKNCSSGQFGQCKKYDHQMVQKLRRPEKPKTDRKSESQQQNLAETREALRELAQQQRRFSEDVKTGRGGTQWDKASPTNGSRQAQRSAAQTAGRLKQQLATNAAVSELAHERMQEITDQIQASADQLTEGDLESASQRALAAAKLLEALDEQLEAMSSPELTERLGHAEQLARRLADTQGKIAKALAQAKPDSPSERVKELTTSQRATAESAKTLAEVLRHLEAEAWGDHFELQRRLDELQETHRPDELAEDVQSIADDLHAQVSRVTSAAKMAASRFAELAADLGEVRRSVLQPQLDQLVAAEAAAAALLQAIQDQQDPARLAADLVALDRQLAELRITMPDVSSHSTSPSSSQPGNGSPSTGGGGNAGTGSGGGEVNEPQFRYIGRNVNAEMRLVIDVLQGKIQDAILLTARMDADEPVPAKYRRLVDEYYQALSDDLR